MQTSNNIPVVIFHEGCPSHLPYSVKSAEKYNRRVILLGNEDNINVAKEWFDAGKLDLTRYNSFLEVFENLSTYSDFFAQICFKRYFLYYELMEELSFDRIMVCESDLYNCCNYSELPSLKEAYAMVSITDGQDIDYGWSACCHCSYWTKRALNDFLDFCYDTFKNNRELLNEKWEYQKKNMLAGGVCDMTLVYLWAKNKEGIINSSKLFDQGTIDQNLCDKVNFSDDEYRYSNLFKIKKYRLVKEKEGLVPYLVTKNNELVRVFAIHCSGRGKAAIKEFSKSYFAVGMSQIKSILRARLGAIKNTILKK